MRHALGQIRRTVRTAPLVIAFLLPGVVAAQEARSYDGPIIDVHLHAYLPEEYDGEARNPITGKAPTSKTAEDHMRRTLAELESHNVVLALVGGPLEALQQWRQAAPERIWAGPEFGRPGVDDSGRPISVDTLHSLYQSDDLQVMGEITAQYEGLSSSDPTLDPYFALAEELDVPVGIHTGTSFPGTPYSGYPEFRVALGNPLLLEDLLVRRPNLRLFIMHGGLPWQREAIELMRMYPQVYVDVAALSWMGGPFFHQFLRDMIAAGLEKRIMFGTDQMRWPEAIGLAIEAVEAAVFLTDEQKADIFYNNAARFLELSEDEIERHHSRARTDFRRPVHGCLCPGSGSVAPVAHRGTRSGDRSSRSDNGSLCLPESRPRHCVRGTAGRGGSFLRSVPRASVPGESRGAGA